MEKIQLYIIDEHPAVCQALANRLSAVPSIEVVGTACSFEDGKDSVRFMHPDVVLLELKGKYEAACTPAEAISWLLAHQIVGVIVLTSYPDETERNVAMHAGAKRYLLKEIDTENLVVEIEAVAREKEIWLAQSGGELDANGSPRLLA